MSRPIYQIAAEIEADWKNVYFGAKPWLESLFSLKSIDDLYGADRADTCVMYFLSNASSWRGEVARRIKAELKQLLKEKK